MSSPSLQKLTRKQLEEERVRKGQAQEKVRKTVKIHVPLHPHPLRAVDKELSKRDERRREKHTLRLLVHRTVVDEEGVTLPVARRTTAKSPGFRRAKVMAAA